MPRCWSLRWQRQALARRAAEQHGMTEEDSHRVLEYANNELDANGALLERRHCTTHMVEPHAAGARQSRPTADEFPCFACSSLGGDGDEASLTCASLCPDGSVRVSQQPAEEVRKRRWYVTRTWCRDLRRAAGVSPLPRGHDHYLCEEHMEEQLAWHLFMRLPIKVREWLNRGACVSCAYECAGEEAPGPGTEPAPRLSSAQAEDLRTSLAPMVEALLYPAGHSEQELAVACAGNELPVVRDATEDNDDGSGGGGLPGLVSLPLRGRNWCLECGCNPAVYLYKVRTDLASERVLCPPCFLALKEQGGGERQPGSGQAQGPGVSGSVDDGDESLDPAEMSLYCCLRPEMLLRLQLMVPRPVAAVAAPAVAVTPSAAAAAAGTSAAPGGHVSGSGQGGRPGKQPRQLQQQQLQQQRAAAAREPQRTLSPTPQRKAQQSPEPRVLRPAPHAPCEVAAYLEQSTRQQPQPQVQLGQPVSYAQELFQRSGSGGGGGRTDGVTPGLQLSLTPVVVQQQPTLSQVPQQPVSLAWRLPTGHQQPHLASGLGIPRNMAGQQAPVPGVMADTGAAFSALQFAVDPNGTVAQQQQQLLSQHPQHQAAFGAGASGSHTSPDDQHGHLGSSCSGGAHGHGQVRTCMVPPGCSGTGGGVAVGAPAGGPLTPQSPAPAAAVATIPVTAAATTAATAPAAARPTRSSTHAISSPSSTAAAATAAAAPEPFPSTSVPELATAAYNTRIVLPGVHTARLLGLPPPPSPAEPPAKGRDWMDMTAATDTVAYFEGALVRCAPHVSKAGTELVEEDCAYLVVKELLARLPDPKRAQLLELARDHNARGGPVVFSGPMGALTEGGPGPLLDDVMAAMRTCEERIREAAGEATEPSSRAAAGGTAAGTAGGGAAGSSGRGSGAIGVGREAMQAATPLAGPFPWTMGGYEWTSRPQPTPPPAPLHREFTPPAPAAAGPSSSSSSPATTNGPTSTTRPSTLPSTLIPPPPPNQLQQRDHSYGPVQLCCFDMAHRYEFGLETTPVSATFTPCAGKTARQGGEVDHAHQVTPPQLLRYMRGMLDLYAVENDPRVTDLRQQCDALRPRASGARLATAAAAVAAAAAAGRLALAGGGAGAAGGSRGGGGGRPMPVQGAARGKATSLSAAAKGQPQEADKAELLARARDRSLSSDLAAQVLAHLDAAAGSSGGGGGDGGSGGGNGGKRPASAAALAQRGGAAKRGSGAAGTADGEDEEGSALARAGGAAEGRHVEDEDDDDGADVPTDDRVPVGLKVPVYPLTADDTLFMTSGDLMRMAHRVLMLHGPPWLRDVLFERYNDALDFGTCRPADGGLGVFGHFANMLERPLLGLELATGTHVDRSQPATLMCFAVPFKVPVGLEDCIAMLRNGMYSDRRYAVWLQARNLRDQWRLQHPKEAASKDAEEEARRDAEGRRVAANDGTAAAGGGTAATAAAASRPELGGGTSQPLLNVSSDPIRTAKRGSVWIIIPGCRLHQLASALNRGGKWPRNHNGFFSVRYGRDLDNLVRDCWKHGVPFHAVLHAEGDLLLPGMAAAHAVMPLHCASMKISQDFLIPAGPALRLIWEIDALRQEHHLRWAARRAKDQKEQPPPRATATVSPAAAAAAATTAAAAAAAAATVALARERERAREREQERERTRARAQEQEVERERERQQEQEQRLGLHDLSCNAEQLQQLFPHEAQLLVAQPQARTRDAWQDAWQVGARLLQQHKCQQQEQQQLQQQPHGQHQQEPHQRTPAVAVQAATPAPRDATRPPAAEAVLAVAAAAAVAAAPPASPAISGAVLAAARALDARPPDVSKLSWGARKGRSQRQQASGGSGGSGGSPASSQLKSTSGSGGPPSATQPPPGAAGLYGMEAAAATAATEAVSPAVDDSAASRATADAGADATADAGAVNSRAAAASSLPDSTRPPATATAAAAVEHTGATAASPAAGADGAGCSVMVTHFADSPPLDEQPPSSWNAAREQVSCNNMEEEHSNLELQLQLDSTGGAASGESAGGGGKGGGRGAGRFGSEEVVEQEVHLVEDEEEEAEHQAAVAAALAAAAVTARAGTPVMSHAATAEEAGLEQGEPEAVRALPQASQALQLQSWKSPEQEVALLEAVAEAVPLAEAEEAEPLATAGAGVEAGSIPAMVDAVSGKGATAVWIRGEPPAEERDAAPRGASALAADAAGGRSVAVAGAVGAQGAAAGVSQLQSSTAQPCGFQELGAAQEEERPSPPPTLPTLPEPQRAASLEGPCHWQKAQPVHMAEGEGRGEGRGEGPRRSAASGGVINPLLGLGLAAYDDSDSEEPEVVHVQSSREGPHPPPELVLQPCANQHEQVPQQPQQQRLLPRGGQCQQQQQQQQEAELDHQLPAQQPSGRQEETRYGGAEAGLDVQATADTGGTDAEYRAVMHYILAVGDDCAAEATAEEDGEEQLQPAFALAGEPAGGGPTQEEEKEEGRIAAGGEVSVAAPSGPFASSGAVATREAVTVVAAEEDAPADGDAAAGGSAQPLELGRAGMEGDEAEIAARAGAEQAPGDAAPWAPAVDVERTEALPPPAGGDGTVDADAGTTGAANVGVNADVDGAAPGPAHLTMSAGQSAGASGSGEGAMQWAPADTAGAALAGPVEAGGAAPDAVAAAAGPPLADAPAAGPSTTAYVAPSVDEAGDVHMAGAPGVMQAEAVVGVTEAVGATRVKQMQLRAKPQPQLMGTTTAPAAVPANAHAMLMVVSHALIPTSFGDVESMTRMGRNLARRAESPSVAVPAAAAAAAAPPQAAGCKPPAWEVAARGAGLLQVQPVAVAPEVCDLVDCLTRLLPSNDPVIVDAMKMANMTAYIAAATPPAAPATPTTSAPLVPPSSRDAAAAASDAAMAEPSSSSDGPSSHSLYHHQQQLLLFPKEQQQQRQPRQQEGPFFGWHPAMLPCEIDPAEWARLYMAVVPRAEHWQLEEDVAGKAAAALLQTRPLAVEAEAEAAVATEAEAVAEAAEPRQRMTRGRQQQQLQKLAQQQQARGPQQQKQKHRQERASTATRRRRGGVYHHSEASDDGLEEEEQQDEEDADEQDDIPLTHIRQAVLGARQASGPHRREPPAKKTNTGVGPAAAVLAAAAAAPAAASGPAAAGGGKRSPAVAGGATGTAKKPRGSAVAASAAAAAGTGPAVAVAATAPKASGKQRSRAPNGNTDRGRAAAAAAANAAYVADAGGASGSAQSEHELALSNARDSFLTQSVLVGLALAVSYTRCHSELQDRRAKAAAAEAGAGGRAR